MAEKTITMKVTLSITLDAEAWAEYNGLGDGAGNFKVADVQEDVRTHILNIAQQLDLLAEADAKVSLA